MIGKIKALGLAFAAVAALSAMAASAAQANQFHIFDAAGPVAPSVITAHSEAGQEHTLQLVKTDGLATLQVKCDTATLEGTISTATPTEATVTATYGTGKGAEAEAQGCLLAGLKAQVLMNGCKYTLTGSHTPVGGQPQTIALTGWVDIVSCTAGKKIEVRSPLAACTLTIGEQNTLSHVVNTNLATAPKTVTSNATVSGITVTQDGVGCPDGNGHTGTKASFAGKTIVKAFRDNVGTDQVTLHQHQYVIHTCGQQIDIQAT